MCNYYTCICLILKQTYYSLDIINFINSEIFGLFFSKYFFTYPVIANFPIT